MSAAPVPGSAVPDSTVPENTLSVRDLTVSRSSGLRMVPAVRGVSLDVAAGESYGLVGESGSGKSTAAMALTRYLPAGTDVSAGR
jgi:peptide/nickel transport system ATP-binding protein